MTVACGQEKTGSSVRSHANPSKRQALSKGSSRYRFQGTRRSRPLTFPCPWARLSILLIGSLSVKTTGSSRPYLHRSAGCHGDGSQFYRNTCSCQCCFYISADRGSRGIHQCLGGSRTRLELFPHSLGNIWPPFTSPPHLLSHLGPLLSFSLSTIRVAAPKPSSDQPTLSTPTAAP